MGRGIGKQQEDACMSYIGAGLGTTRSHSYAEFQTSISASHHNNSERIVRLNYASFDNIALNRYTSSVGHTLNAILRRTN